MKSRLFLGLIGFLAAPAFAAPPAIPPSTPPIASTAISGTVKVDGSTINITNGVISATTGGSGCTVSGAAGAVYNNGSSACVTRVDQAFAAGTLTLGTNTSEAGVLKVFGGTSGDLSIKSAAVAGTSSVLTFPGATFDFSASGGANRVVQQTSAGGAFSVAQLGFSNLSGTVATAQIANSAVTYAKIQNGGADGLFKSNSGAAPTEVGLGTGFAFSGGNLTYSVVTGGGLLASNNLSDVASVPTSRVNLGIDSQSQHGAASVALAATEHYVTTCNNNNSACNTGTWNTAATWTLPAYNASGLNDGATVTVADDPQVVTSVNTLTIQPNTGDTINQSASATTMNYGGQKLVCQLKQSDRNWVCVASLPNGPSLSILIGQGTTATPSFGVVSGDVQLSALGAITVDHVNSVAYPTNATTNQVMVGTASRTMTAETLPSCTDSGGNHLNYNSGTQVFTCGTTSSKAGTVTSVDGSGGSTGLTLTGPGGNPITASGALTLGGTLGLGSGGTGVSLTGTGGTSRVLQQLSTGANVTVAQLGFSDLTSSASAAQISTNLSAALDTMAGSTQGGIIYRNASLWVLLGPGTSGNFLKTNGASANPSWAAASGGSGCTTGGASGNVLTSDGGTGCTVNNDFNFGSGTASVGIASTETGTFKLFHASGSGSTSIALANPGASNFTATLPANTGTVSEINFAETFSAVKTFSSAPVISTITNTGTITLPTSTDTLVGRATTDTLTNKSIAGTEINSSLVGVTYGGTGANLSATGAAHSVLQQASSGAAVTVGQLACGDLSDAGTACPASTGTSGAKLPFLNGANTWSGAQLFGTADLTFTNASGGVTTVASVASASNFTATFPANTGTVSETNLAETFSAVKTFSVAPVISTITNTGTLTLPTSTDTMVGRATTDTLTNKSIDASQLTSTVAVANGGTNLASGTSGGILGYTASGTLASSGALTNHALVVGGGAGATPGVVASLGTSTTVLHGAAAGNPTFGAVSLTADVSGLLPKANGGTAAATGNAAATNLSLVYVIQSTTTTTGAHTGDTTDTKLASCTIPAGLLDANGVIRVTVQFAKIGTAGSMTPILRFGAANDLTGTTMASGQTMTSASRGLFWTTTITNRNSVSSQIGTGIPSAGNNYTTGALPTTAVNTASTSYVVASGALANSADTEQVEVMLCEYIPGGGN